LLAEVIRVIMIEAKNDAVLPLLIHRVCQNDWSGITHFYITLGSLFLLLAGHPLQGAWQRPASSSFYI